VGLFVIIAIGLALLGGVGWISLYHAAAATLPNEIKKAKQEGLPLTPADLERPIAVPDAQNAALLYAQIAGVNVYPEEESKELLKASTPYTRAPERKDAPRADACVIAVINGKATEADRKATQQLLVKAAPQLHLVEQAALLPDCDFHCDWSLGPDLLLPEYVPMRETARLLAAQAVLQSEAGHPEAALHTIGIGARMAQHVGKDPIIMALLLRLAIEAIMDRAFVHIVNKYADRPDILRLAVQTEQTFGVRPDVRNALRGEVVVCRLMADSLRKEEARLPSNVYVRKPILGVPQTVTADTYEARSLSFWRRVFAAVNRTPDDSMATYLAFKAVNEEEAAMEKTTDGKVKPTYEWNELLCPYFSGAAERVVGNETQRCLRRTLFALFAYRQKEGHFPDALASLSPAAPSDPYTNQPLRYRRTEKGFLLYSVGSNLTDDGGNRKPAKKGDLPPDIVLAFP
jgi:hypothetical protein